MEGEVDHPPIQKTRPVISHRGVLCRPCRGQIGCQERMRTMSLSLSMSGRRSMTVMGEDGNWAKVDGEGITLMKASDL